MFIISALISTLPCSQDSKLPFPFGYPNLFPILQFQSSLPFFKFKHWSDKSALISEISPDWLSHWKVVLGCAQGCFGLCHCKMFSPHLIMWGFCLFIDLVFILLRMQNLGTIVMTFYRYSKNIWGWCHHLNLKSTAKSMGQVGLLRFSQYLCFGFFSHFMVELIFTMSQISHSPTFFLEMAKEL